WRNCAGEFLTSPNSQIPPSPLACWSMDSDQSDGPVYTYFVTAVGPDDCESGPGVDTGFSDKKASVNKASMISGDSLMLVGVIVMLLMTGLIVARRQSATRSA